MRLLHKHDPHPQIYQLYQKTLLTLQEYNLQQSTLRLFEKKLLEELGYGLQLQYDMSDGKTFSAEQLYRFIPEQGVKRYQEQENANPVLIFSGKSLIALATDIFNDIDSLRDAKRLMRLALTSLLGTQPLHSRKLFTEREIHEK